MPCARSVRSSTASPLAGAVKLGQPERLSYFVSLSKEVTPPERERITAIAQEVFEHRLTDVVFEVCSPSAECPDPPGN